MHRQHDVRTLIFVAVVVATSLLAGPLIASFTSGPAPASVLATEVSTEPAATASRTPDSTQLSAASSRANTQADTPSVTARPSESVAATETVAPTASTTPAEDLATPTSTSTPAATATPSEQVYAVRPGDTLITIAEQFDVSVDALRRRNDLTSDTLRVGRELVIPASAEDEASTRVNSSGERVYVVEPGDILLTIAEQYDVSVAAIRQRNDLTGNALQVGQELIIPASP